MAPGELAEVLAMPGLPGLLKKVEVELRAVTSSAMPPLDKPLALLAHSGGKRLRPVLVLASAEAAGGEPAKGDYARAAAAVELVHLASLVHDDLIDGSVRRRGRPAVQIQEGQAIALLAGDFLLAKAVSAAATLSPNAGEVIARTIARMAEGQALGIANDNITSPVDPGYQNIIRLKTASLMSAACRLGVMAASAESKRVEALAAFGDAFGMAFQLIDDVLDGDFKPALNVMAVDEARHYSSQAAEALKKLPNSAVKSGLAALPAHYANWALGARNAIV